jgi:hypothetical protein
LIETSAVKIRRQISRLRGIFTQSLSPDPALYKPDQYSSEVLVLDAEVLEAED